MHVNIKSVTSCPRPSSQGRGSLCVRVLMVESVELLFGVLVISEPQCLKYGPLRGSGPPDRWSDDFQYAED